jgi:hypothetical protein
VPAAVCWWLVLQLGAGTLSGLAQFGLTRTQLMDTGLSAAVVERLYRSLYVYSIGFHDTLQDLISQGCATKQRAGVVTNLWKSFLTISEKSLKVRFLLLQPQGRRHGLR